MWRPISSLNPFFYFIIVRMRRFVRYCKWWLGGQRFAKKISSILLDHLVFKHQSLLLRKLGDSDIRLQYNKVTNISIAVQKLDKILIRPGETFSFHYLVGATTKKKGYLEGLFLSNGEAAAGIGGGLCQIANLIHWLVLHSPLTVTERHHHSYDLFPDNERTVPFGSGATLFYNYLDYQFTNNTHHTFQLLFWLDESYFHGELRSDTPLPCRYHVYEKNHQFVKTGEQFYRRNELWRDTICLRSSAVLTTELLQKNNSFVKYVPEEYILHERHFTPPFEERR